MSHHYFRERAVEFNNRIGRDKMILELHNDGDMFQATDHHLYAEMATILEKLGIGGEEFQKSLAQCYAAYGVDSLTDKP